MARRIAWWAWGIGLALRLVQLWVVTHPAPDRVFMAYGIGLATFLAAIVFGTSAATVGLIIAARVPGNRFGWIWVATGLAQGVFATLLLVAADHVASGSSLALAAGVFASAGVLTAPFLSTGLGLLSFPEGRLISPRWRLLGWGVAAAAALRALEVVFGTSTILLLPTVTNRYAGGPLGAVLERLDASRVGLWLLPLGVALCATSVVVRYRRADVTGRRQIRWFLLGAAALVATLVPFAYASLVGGALEAATAGIFALAFLGYSLLPLTTLVAITRYRLYEVDRIVNRAVLYASLTAILAGVFTAAIALAQRLFVAATGEHSDAAIVLTTLVVATAYAPLRKRLEAVVDHRFKYDRASFGPYRDEVIRYLDLSDTTHAAERLARETLVELRSTAAAVLSAAGAVTASAGAWPVTEETRIPIPGGGGRMAMVVTGPRTDGAPHDPLRVAELAELAGLVAEATRVAAPARR